MELVCLTSSSTRSALRRKVSGRLRAAGGRAGGRGGRGPGLPFDYSRLQTGEDGTVLEELHGAFDEVRFVNLGDGQQGRAEYASSHADVREHLSEDEHRSTVEAAAVSEDVPLEIRTMRPEESFELRVASTGLTATATTGTLSTTRTGSGSCRRRA